MYHLDNGSHVKTPLLMAIYLFTNVYKRKNILNAQNKQGIVHERENVQRTERLICIINSEFLPLSSLVSAKQSEKSQGKMDRDHQQRYESEDLNTPLKVHLSLPSCKTSFQFRCLGCGESFHLIRFNI